MQCFRTRILNTFASIPLLKGSCDIAIPFSTQQDDATDRHSSSRHRYGNRARKILRNTEAIERTIGRKGEKSTQRAIQSRPCAVRRKSFNNSASTRSIASPARRTTLALPACPTFPYSSASTNRFGARRIAVASGISESSVWQVEESKPGCEREEREN